MNTPLKDQKVLDEYKSWPLAKSEPPVAGSATCYARYITDFEIIRDKIASIRLHFVPTDDHRAMAIEAELWHAQQSMEDAIRHAHNDQAQRPA